MKKTIKQWLQELEEPYRTQALEHAKAYGINTNIESSLDQALLAGFIWEDTLQGWDYWNDVRQDIFRAEIIKENNS